MLVHQIVTEQNINFRSAEILSQIPNGTKIEMPGFVGGNRTNITLTKQGLGWLSDVTGDIIGDGQQRIRVIKNRAVSGQLSGKLTQQAFSNLGITPQVRVDIPKGDPHGIKPEQYRNGRVTWIEYDAEGNASRKTGSLAEYDKEYKARAARNVQVKKAFDAETEAYKSRTAKRSRWFRRTYMGLAWFAAGYTAVDMFATYWNDTSQRKARLMSFVQAGALTQADMIVEYKKYKKQKQAELLSGVESVGVSVLVGALFARVGTARALSVAAKIGRAGGKLPRWSLPTLIGWGIGVAATVGAEYLLGKMERDTFYQMFIDWVKGDDEAAGDEFNQSELPGDLPEHQPLSQEEMQQMADSLQDKIDNGEIDMPGVDDPEDVDRIINNFRNLYGN